jgi:hypothetical protein
MANRVLVGKRGSDHGLFVSRAGQNVVTSDEPLGFDSRAVESLIVQSYGQNVLVPQVQHRTSGAQLAYSDGSNTYTQHQHTITHNLGYIPAYAVRFCSLTQISGGVATSSYSPFTYSSGSVEYQEDDEESGDEVTYPEASGTVGLSITDVTTSSFKLTNVGQRTYDDVVGKATSLGNDSIYFYSYVIFTADNFLNNGSL